MSYKVVQNLGRLFLILAAAIKLNKKEAILETMRNIEEINAQGLNLGREFQIRYLLRVHSVIKRKLKQIKKSPKNESLAIIKEILDLLSSITNQSEVRDEIIKRTIHPIMKSWGWLKKGRSFFKKEGNLTKRLVVYSSRNNDYYSVSFTFEMEVMGGGHNVYGKRIPGKAKWYTLTEDSNLEEIKARIEADLNGPVKEFFDQF